MGIADSFFEKEEREEKKQKEKEDGGIAEA